MNLSSTELILLTVRTVVFTTFSFPFLFDWILANSENYANFYFSENIAFLMKKPRKELFSCCFQLSKQINAGN